MLKGRVHLRKNIDSLIHEIQILTYLKHPFLTNIHYAFQDFDNLYLVMDYSPGLDLATFLNYGFNITEKYVKFMISCVLIGLDYIHSKGIIHKDIKPDNIFFDKDGYLKLGDFGIAQVFHLNNSATPEGSLRFAAPEIVCRQNYGIASDYFPLGIMLYRIMFNQLPYLSNSFEEYVFNMLRNPVVANYDNIPYG